VIGSSVDYSIKSAACDGNAALKYLERVANMPVRVRYLADASPIAAAWLDTGEEAAHKKWPVAVRL
jgi:hypothetical protein